MLLIMGLDMYLYRTKKVEGLTGKDYGVIDDYVAEHVESLDDVPSLNLEALCGIHGANALKDEIWYYNGPYLQWYRIMHKVGYWRKANQVHAWFVDVVQGGVDDCDYYLVSKENVEKLLGLVNGILNKELQPNEALPTREGFFFGSTDYDEYYEEDIKNTQEILTRVLEETNFDEEVLIYCSSW